MMREGEFQVLFASAMGLGFSSNFMCPQNSFPHSSDLGHQLKSAGRRCDYLHLTVTWVRFLSQEQHPY